MLLQGIIIMNRNRNFAKEPEFARLLRRLKSTPVLNNKNFAGFFFRMFVMANLLCFECFTAG